MNGAALTAAVAFSLASAAYAQTGTAPAPTPAPKSNTDSSSQGVRMADSATVAVRFVNVQPADFMASQLIGATVYNKQNESIGQIEDLVIGDGKTVTGIVVAVGGILGIGESHVVIDPSTVVLSQRGGAWHASVDTTKDELKDAPKFTYSKLKK